jgi:hypothetical protein
LLNKVSAKAGTDDDDDDDDMDDGGGVLAVAAKDHRSGNIRSPSLRSGKPITAVLFEC